MPSRRGGRGSARSSARSSSTSSSARRPPSARAAPSRAREQGVATEVESVRRSQLLFLFGLAAGGAWALARRLGKIELAGRVALVTGGSRGLGLVLSRELGRRGMRVVICARDEEELERA